MVGSMFQAEIPVGICKYRENEKGESWCCENYWFVEVSVLKTWNNSS